MPSQSHWNADDADALATLREREAANREILQVISRSRDDEAPVFDTILDNASRLCDAPLAFLSIVNDECTHFRIPAYRGARPAMAAIWDKAVVPIAESGTVTSWAIREKCVYQIKDFWAEPTDKDPDGRRNELIELEGVRSYIVIPMFRGADVVGTINLYRREVKPFDAEQIALVEIFAAQAVIAIENVRQFRELQTRLEREAATSKILQVISHSREDEAPVFDVILECASRICNAPMAGMHMANDARTEIHVVANRGLPTEALEVQSFSIEIGAASTTARAVNEGIVIHSHDIADDPLYKLGDPRRRAAVDLLGARTTLVVPLISKDKAIGCIWIFRREVNPYTEDEIALLQSFAAQAVIAIENVRQFRALRASNEEVRTQAAQLQALNAELESRVEQQVGEIERIGRLKRFLPPAVVDAVVSSGDERLLSSHRAFIAVLFCDMRGFTAFCETAEPEETIEILQSYHEEMGRLIREHGGGVDSRSGDGIMVIFNDPLPCDDPASDAVQLALAMRERMATLCKSWRRLGHRLGFGVGISLGYATVGMVGSEGRYDYTASGTSVNLAARLCDAANDGEILLSPRARAAVEDKYAVEPAGDLNLKGIQAPVEVYKVLAD